MHKTGCTAIAHTLRGMLEDGGLRICMRLHATVNVAVSYCTRLVRVALASAHPPCLAELCHAYQGSVLRREGCQNMNVGTACLTSVKMDLSQGAALCQQKNVKKK